MRKHIDVVIELQQQCITARQRFDQIGGAVTHIREYANFAMTIGSGVLHRLTRIMRYGVRLDFEIADHKGLAIPADMYLHAISVLAHRLEGAVCHPDGDVVAPGDAENTTDMILVFMRDDDAGELIRTDVESAQT